MIPKSGNRFPAFAKPASAGKGRSDKIMRKQNVAQKQRAGMAARPASSHREANLVAGPEVRRPRRTAAARAARTLVIARARFHRIGRHGAHIIVTGGVTRPVAGLIGIAWLVSVARLIIALIVIAAVGRIGDSRACYHTGAKAARRRRVAAAARFTRPSQSQRQGAG